MACMLFAILLGAGAGFAVTIIARETPTFPASWRARQRAGLPVAAAAATLVAGALTGHRQTYTLLAAVLSSARSAGGSLIADWA